MPDGRDSSPSHTPPSAGPATDFKSLYRKLEAALAEIVRTEDVAETLEMILDTLVSGFRDELGFNGGRIYQRKGNDYYLCCGFGTSRDTPVGLRVPRDYPPHLQTLDQGLLIMRKGDPGFDEGFEQSIGVDSTFAAIAVGRDNLFVIAFSIDGDVHEDRVAYSLTAVRHVINLKLEQQEFTGMLKEARAIQESMLPALSPELPGYDIAGRSRPAEMVSGDLFDYLPLSSDLLGIAIADASGHGFPAALIARDAITGLRMLTGENEKLTGAIERLNDVIHRQALSSKFVSLFYGELTADGTLVYCNAGHNGPLLLRSGSCRELLRGGPVLGPIPGASYERGEERLDPGDTLAMFTDGIVERANAAGEPFGTERLRTLLLKTTGAPAERVVDAIYDAVDRHASGAAQGDDMTVVVVRRV